MRVLKGIGRFIWRFMVIFSFIVNLVLLVVVAVLLLLIFDIKNNIATPLVSGLHSSFVGLDNATIDWTIPVRDEIQVKLDIPLKTDTIVTLTEPVPLNVLAQINAPGLTVTNANVSLSLPVGLELPVSLDLDVAVDQPLPVELDVRAVIPLKETQLHDPFENLRLLFEPLAVPLHNLPNDFNGAFQMIGQTLTGNPPNLLAPNEYSTNPWTGYSKTAGYNYNLLSEPMPAANQPLETGIIPLGGIPALDEQLRPEVYQQGGPQAVNEQVRAQAAGIPPQFYNGQFWEYRRSLLQNPPTGAGEVGIVPAGDQNVPPADPAALPTIEAPVTTETQNAQPDQGIIPTPAG